MGVANKRSIAWGIANAANKAGARLVLTYQNERLGENVRELATQLNNPLLVPCDVASDEQIQALMGRISEEVGHLDFMASMSWRSHRAKPGRNVRGHETRRLSTSHWTSAPIHWSQFRERLCH